MKRVALFLLVVAVVVVVYFFPLIKYGVGQATGQLKIIWHAQAIEDYVKSPDITDSVKAKIDFVKEVRRFAVDSLGLNDSDNYTTIYDQQGQPVLWVVTGCKPFAFEAKEWKFPVLGSVPYKGFFSLEKAKKEMTLVEQKGYDAGIRTVGGWSTLGWFKDPILSNMLHRSHGDLANLIIHELVHATIFVRDSVEFNENLAAFIGDKGADLFMRNKYGRDSEIYRTYRKERLDEKKYIRHILNGVDTLEALYQSIGDHELSEKIRLKEALIEEIMQSADTLLLSNSDQLGIAKGFVPNNTYFMSFMRYRAKQELLEKIFAEKFNYKIKSFILFLKKKHPYL
ncbi:MAG: aminopeptidase [Fulvivirga sp.]|nr:aminopeptidase [Fulvivirga sp.]